MVDVPTTRTAALPERRTLNISDIDCAISEKYRRSILALVESNSVRAEIVLSEDSGRIGPPLACNALGSDVRGPLPRKFSSRAFKPYQRIFVRAHIVDGVYVRGRRHDEVHNVVIERQGPGIAHDRLGHHSSGFPHVLFRKIQKILAKFSFGLLDCVARRFGIDSVRSSVGKVHRPADTGGFCDDD